MVKKPLRLLALKPRGIALPAIHDSIVRALRSLGVSVSEIPVPTAPEEILSFQPGSNGQFEAVLALDAGVSPEFISVLKKKQTASKIPWQRVINREGRISIVHEVLTAKFQAELLRKEGVEVHEENESLWIDLKKFGWKYHINLTNM